MSEVLIELQKEKDIKKKDAIIIDTVTLLIYPRFSRLLSNPNVSLCYEITSQRASCMPHLRDSLLYTSHTDPDTKNPSLYLPNTLELCCAYTKRNFAQYCLLKRKVAISKGYTPEVLKFLVDRVPDKIDLVERALEMAQNQKCYLSQNPFLTKHPHRVFQCLTPQQQKEILPNLSEQKRTLLTSHIPAIQE